MRSLLLFLEILELWRLHMTFKTQSLIVLAVLSIVDAVIPVPIVGLILILIFLQKPPWFQRLVREVYEA